MFSISPWHYSESAGVGEKVFYVYRVSCGCTAPEGDGEFKRKQPLNPQTKEDKKIVLPLSRFSAWDTLTYRRFKRQMQSGKKS